MKPKSIRFTPASRLATHGLAKNLYPSFLAAMLEIIFNGIDSATRRGVEPKIDISFYATGIHPMAPKSNAVAATDNGTGFTSEVIEAFGNTGESISFGRADLHGTHGLGKFAPFALGEGVGEFSILSNTGGGETWVYRVKGDNIFGQTFEPEEPKRGVEKFLPPNGPFAQIFVAGIDPQDPDEFRANLANHLPLRPLTVTVDGKIVEPRKFATSEAFTTPTIPMIGGPVHLMFAMAQVSTADDAVWLYDTNGRQVGELLSAVTRPLLDPVFRHPRLIAIIKAPGLEKKSSSSRTGLNAAFWKSGYGRKLLEVLAAYGVPLAKKVIGAAEDIESDPLRASIKVVADLFTAGFGSPDSVKEKEPRSRPTKPGGGNTGGSGGGGGGDDDPGKTWVRVEDNAYRVMSFPTSHPLPAEVRKGGIIVINTNHPEVRRLEKVRNPRLLKEAIIRALVEAHVVKTRPTAADHIGAVYELAKFVFDKM